MFIHAMVIRIGTIWQAPRREQGHACPQALETRTAAARGATAAANPRRSAADQRVATPLIFSAVTARRLEIGWNISPASLTIVSVIFEVSATIASNEDLASSP